MCVWGCVLSSLIFLYIKSFISYLSSTNTFKHTFYCLVSMYWCWIQFFFFGKSSLLTTEAFYFLSFLNIKNPPHWKWKCRKENCKNTKPKQKRINLTRGNKSVQALGQRSRGGGGAKRMMLRDIKFKWVYFLVIVVECLPCSIHIMFY